MENIKSIVDRRNFVKSAGAVAGALLFSGNIFAKQTNKPLVQPPLPYALDALEPHVSEKTLNLHYNRHHKGYYKLVSRQVTGTQYHDSSLAEIIRKAHGSIDGVEEATFYMALLAWNHDFYWKSMKPQGGGKPGENCATMIDASLGGYDTFRKKFKREAMKPGSGWVWLVHEGGKLSVVRTTYHDTALLKEKTPLLTIDVWEHAYYLDYKDDKEKYVDAYLDNLVNWDFVESNIKGPTQKSEK
ncbi:MAG: superoxide dismutase [Chitinivibrionales bacterium]|nr:superoxide dismutase [Chitinivibrionales bacterium]